MPTAPLPLLIAAGLGVGVAVGIAAEGAGLSPMAEPEASVEEDVEVLGNAVSVLDCPDGTPIAVLAGGDVVLATGQADDGRWIEIRWPLDETGNAWVPAGSLAAEGSLDSLPKRHCDEASFVPTASGATPSGASATPAGASATSSAEASTTTQPGRTTTFDPAGTRPPRRNAPARTVPRPPVPPTTVPGTTVPGTTVPGTTVPATTVPPTTVPPTTVPPTTAPDRPPTLGDPASSQLAISTTDASGGPCLPFVIPETAEITVSASDDQGAPDVTMTYRTVADGEVVSIGTISVEGPVDGVYRGTLGPLPLFAADGLADTVAEVTIVASDSAGQRDTRVFVAALVTRCPV